MIYALGSAGAELLGVSTPKVPKLQYLDHAVAVSAVIVAFTLACRERGSVRVIPCGRFWKAKYRRRRGGSAPLSPGRCASRARGQSG